VMVIADVWSMIDLFFLEWHTRDGTATHDSLRASKQRCRQSTECVRK
jgi:hypothetical protein